MSGAVDATAVIRRAVDFIEGFKGDDMQEGIDALLADLGALLTGNVLSPKPAMIVTVEGGAVTCLQGSVPMDVLFVDYDVDGMEDLVEVRQPDSEGNLTDTIEEARVFFSPAEVCPALVEDRFRVYDLSEGGAC